MPRLILLLLALAAPGPAAPGPTATCPLDGLPTTPELAARRPLGVMVENTPAARPQSGLDRACLVYETLAEGGITRYLPLFVHRDAEIIGPIRSTRQVFASLARGIDAFLGHCWAKPSGYATVKRLRVYNVDVVRPRSRKRLRFWRYDGRPKPHNLYSSTEEFRAMGERSWRGGRKIAPLAPRFVFREELPPEARPAGGTLRIDYSTRRYRAEFVYDREHNAWRRRLAGAWHRVAEHPARATRHLIRPRNVVVLEMRMHADDKGILDVRCFGKGRALLFREGRRLEGRWLRPSELRPWKLVDLEGKPMELVPGQVWVAIVPSLKRVRWTPAPALRSEPAAAHHQDARFRPPVVDDPH